MISASSLKRVSHSKTPKTASINRPLSISSKWRGISIVFLLVGNFVRITGAAQNTTSLLQLLFTDQENFNLQFPRYFKSFDRDGSGVLSERQITKMMKSILPQNGSLWATDDLMLPPYRNNLDNEEQDDLESMNPNNVSVSAKKTGITYHQLRDFLFPIMNRPVPLNNTKCEILKKCPDIPQYNIDQCFAGWDALEMYWLEDCVSKNGCNCLSKKRKQERATHLISMAGSWALTSIYNQQNESSSSNSISWLELFKPRGLNETIYDGVIVDFGKRNRANNSMIELKKWYNAVSKFKDPLISKLWENIKDSTASFYNMSTCKSCPSCVDYYQCSSSNLVTVDELQDWFHEEIQRPKEIQKSLCFESHERSLYYTLQSLMTPSLFNWNPAKKQNEAIEIVNNAAIDFQQCLIGQSLWTNYQWEKCIMATSSASLPAKKLAKRLKKQCGTWNSTIDSVTKKLPAPLSLAALGSSHLQKRSFGAMLLPSAFGLGITTLIYAVYAFILILPFTIPSFIFVHIKSDSKKNAKKAERTKFLVRGGRGHCDSVVYWGGCGWMGTPDSQLCPEGGRLVNRKSCTSIHNFSKSSRICTVKKKDVTPRRWTQWFMGFHQFQCQSLCVRTEPPNCGEL